MISRLCSPPCQAPWLPRRRLGRLGWPPTTHLRGLRPRRGPHSLGVGPSIAVAIYSPQGVRVPGSHIGYFFDLYIPGRQDREDWRFAPLMAEAVEGAAPAWFGLAECDPLVDEGLQYADKLRYAGVPVDLEIYRGVTHEFIKMGRAIPEARRAHLDAARALKHAFA